MTTENFLKSFITSSDQKCIQTLLMTALMVAKGITPGLISPQPSLPYYPYSR